MSILPYRRAHDFDATREQLFRDIERLLLRGKMVRTKHGLLPAFMLTVEQDADLCQVSMIALLNGILIETNQLSNVHAYNRIWTLDPFLGNISYIEIDNPQLRNQAIFDNTDPNCNTFEMHVMPTDVAYLRSVITACIRQSYALSAKATQPLSPTLTTLLNA